MSLDYDLHVLNSSNNDTKEYQMRDCICHAIEEIDHRLQNLEGALQTRNAMDKKMFEMIVEIDKRLKQVEGDSYQFEDDIARCLDMKAWTTREINKLQDFMHKTEIKNDN